MSNIKFQNAIARAPQKCPPIWFMRQAGRYHSHYQKLKEKYDFMTLCKEPELAAEVAMGPIEDFDFDVSILFSDLLFPLEALGMGLRYDPGPILDRKLLQSDLKNLKPLDEAVEFLKFQHNAVKCTRQRLPDSKSLIGFIGGPWTLFTYAVSGGHDGSLIEAKRGLTFYDEYLKTMLPLLKKNIELQLEGGAEVVMIFDTAAGELSPDTYNRFIAKANLELANAYPGRVGYYSKWTQSAHLTPQIFSANNWAGVGVDHRWDLAQAFRLRKSGFVQGNFDQALLFLEPADLKSELSNWLRSFSNLSENERAGWVCGLGHGVLPKTPERNVRMFIETVRKTFS